jgi:flagellar basal body-associated protein FliL
MEFSKKDFDDIGIENDSTSIWIKILVVIVLLAFLAGLFFFLKSVLNF